MLQSISSRSFDCLVVPFRTCTVFVTGEVILSKVMFAHNLLAAGFAKYISNLFFLTWKGSYKNSSSLEVCIVRSFLRKSSIFLFIADEIIQLAKYSIFKNGKARALIICMWANSFSQAKFDTIIFPSWCSCD